MREIERQCVESYRQHKHLKAVGAELGIPWQTVYVHLRKVGEPVTGDKARYGSPTDRLATKAETDFQRLVPNAEDQNRRKFQSKVDFIVNGWSVDVKAGRLRGKVPRWAYSIKKQEAIADFFVCFGYCNEGSNLEYCLLVPGEIARKYTTMSISPRVRSGKWWAYEVRPDELNKFFVDMGDKA